MEDVLGLLQKLDKWSKTGVAEKTLWLTLVGVVAAIIPIAMNYFSSPEEDLVRFGYRKSHEDMWNAVVNKNIRAVELFTKTNIRLDRRDFDRLFSDDIFNPVIVDALSNGTSVDEGLCPTDINSLEIYRAAEPNVEKARRLRHICGKSSIIKSIQYASDIEKNRLKNLLEMNKYIPINISQCKHKYESDTGVIDESVNFNILGVSYYTERQCILAGINVFLLVGDTAELAGGRVIQKIIGECCERYNPLQDVSNARLQTADAAIRMLSAKEK